MLDSQITDILNAHRPRKAVSKDILNTSVDSTEFQKVIDLTQLD